MNKSIQSKLKAENTFISNLFSIVDFPDRYNEVVDSDEEAAVAEKKPQLLGERKSRAQSMTDLQKRLELIQSKQNRQTYKEKLKKKNLKTVLKKKSKKEERSAQKKLERAQKTKMEANTENKANDEDVEAMKPNNKPVFNSDGKMVFSKFDFSGLGSEKKKNKSPKDPKKILENLNKQKEKLEQLEASGVHDKVAAIQNKTAWKNAIAKAEGEKVRDDPILLKKTLKKAEQIKKASKKKWDQRIESVKKDKADRQKKRKENIDKRIKAKKTNKLKKAAKKGRIIAGF